jgi:hypothetical protein
MQEQVVVHPGRIGSPAEDTYESAWTEGSVAYVRSYHQHGSGKGLTGLRSGNESGGDDSILSTSEP